MRRAIKMVDRELALLLCGPFMSQTSFLQSLVVCERLCRELPPTLLFFDCSRHSRFSNAFHLEPCLRDLRVNNAKIRAIADRFTNLKDLNLRRCYRVTQIPSLQHLSVLCLDGTQVKDDTPLNHLNLTSLSLKYTKLTKGPELNKSTIVELNLSSSELSCLETIAQYPNLKILDVGSTRVRNLDAIKTCTALVELSLSGTDVVDVSPLKTLKNLTALNLNGTRVSSFEFAENLKNLECLFSNRTRVLDVNGLRLCFKLRVLTLDFTKIVDVHPIGGLLSLEKLCLCGTDVIDVSPLLTCVNLSTLILFDTRVRDISTLGGCAKLRALNLDFTKIRDVSALASCLELQEIHIFGARVTNVSALNHVRSVIGFGSGYESYDTDQEGEE